MRHLTAAELEAGLPRLRATPRDEGRVVLIVRRPAEGGRELVDEGVLDTDHGLVGDNWLARGSRSMPDGSADPERQITVMNARAARLVAGPGADDERVALCGDQIYVDFDLGVDNLPAGTLLAMGDAMLEVSVPPHLGCKKFVARFGAEAMRFVNSRVGREMRLRGLNARVVTGGRVRVGDAVRRADVSVPTSRTEPGQVDEPGQAHRPVTVE